MEKPLTKEEKKKLLSELVKLYVLNGVDISDIIGSPLGKWNYSAVKRNIITMRQRIYLSKNDLESL